MASAEIRSRAEAGDARAQILLAASLDDAGQHTDAINWLAVAGRQGDANALTLLGLRLVTGRNAPFMPAQGAGLLADAAKLGGAEAAGHLAVLLALGFHIEQSWQGALDYLLRSAELGSASSQAQLRILADQTAADRAGAPQAWRRLRQAIDLRPWLEPVSPSRTLSEDPLVCTFDGMLSLDACAWMAAQSRDKLVRAQVYGAEHGGGVTAESRTNTTANFTLDETNLLNLLIQAKIGAATKTPLSRLEAFTVLHYEVGEEFREHFDFIDPSEPAFAAEIARMGQRVGTFLVYLNDDYQGGETVFPKLGITHRGAKGDGLLFWNCDAAGRPDVRSSHAGRPPTSGEKWILTQFIRNKPVIAASM